MKNTLKRIFVFLLCTTLVFNSCIATVYASEGDRDSGGHRAPTQEEKDAAIKQIYMELGIDPETGRPYESNDKKTLKAIWTWIVAQNGAVGDYEKISENNEAFNEDIKEIWTKDNIKVQFSGDSLKPNIVFSKTLSDQILKLMQETTQKTEKGGYELVKTVPVNKVSTLYFNTSAEYRTMYELLKDNNGMIGVTCSTSAGVGYIKVEQDGIWIKSGHTTHNGVKYSGALAVKNVNSGMLAYYVYGLVDKDTTVSKWADDGKSGFEGLARVVNSKSAGTFYMNDLFQSRVDMKNGTNAIKDQHFLVTTTGTTIPVFNTIDDAVAYSIMNNLYYTTSDFTGQGQEITIDDDELEKILSGYYEGMYDMLQKLIEQNGGNALTPEQVQALADQVAASFDMLKAEINKGFEEQDALIQANSNILKAIKSIMEKGINDIKKLLSDMLEQLKKMKNWTAVNTVLNGLDLLTDLADFIKDFFDDVSVGVGVLVTGFQDTINLAKKKFPFSIPWDIAFLIAFLADTPQTPVFEIPFVLNSYGISEKIVIDFSHFSSVSKVSRLLLTMIYTVGLLKLTNKIIGNKRGI